MALTYGFFNSAKTSGGYDRVYSGNDFNSYFKGVINQNGIFSSVPGQFKMTIDVGHFDEYYNHARPAAFDDARLAAAGNTAILTTVDAGKAIVSSHWINMPNQMAVYLPAPGVTERVDKISLRSDSKFRECYICVETTVPSGRIALKYSGSGDISILDGSAVSQSTIRIPVDGRSGTYEAPAPIGQRQSGSEIIFEDENGLCEIVLAFVYVPVKSDSGVSSFKIMNQHGTGRCPWISHLIQNPNTKDVDRWLSEYTVMFDSWIKDQMASGQIDFRVRASKTVLAAGSPLPIILAFPTEGAPSEYSTIPGYAYDPDDHFLIYYNGLALTEGREFEIVKAGTDGLMITFPLIEAMYTKIPSKNEMEIVIFKGFPVNVPNANI